jgi:hypothetical protein
LLASNAFIALDDVTAIVCAWIVAMAASTDAAPLAVPVTDWPCDVTAVVFIVRAVATLLDCPWLVATIASIDAVAPLPPALKSSSKLI